MNKFSRHTAVIPLAILLTILVYNVLKSHECEGPIEAFVIVILSFISILLVIGTSVYYFFKYQNESIKFKMFPLQLCLIFVIVFIIGKAIISLDFKGTPYISAKKVHRDIVTLYKDNSYKIQDAELEWTCYYNGFYKIFGDTIKLDKMSKRLLDNGFSSIYLKRNNFLIPICADTLVNDSTEFLKIN